MKLSGSHIRPGRGYVLILCSDFSRTTQVPKQLSCVLVLSTQSKNSVRKKTKTEVGTNSLSVRIQSDTLYLWVSYGSQIKYRLFP